MLSRTGLQSCFRTIAQERERQDCQEGEIVTSGRPVQWTAAIHSWVGTCGGADVDTNPRQGSSSGGRTGFGGPKSGETGKSAEAAPPNCSVVRALPAAARSKRSLIIRTSLRPTATHTLEKRSGGALACGRSSRLASSTSAVSAWPASTAALKHRLASCSATAEVQRKVDEKAVKWVKCFDRKAVRGSEMQWKGSEGGHRQ